LLDRALVVCALLFGLVSVCYPFGGDQGLYYYVGREWLAGSVPYRDAMEQKTPLVFLLHALLLGLTGQNMWAIRVAELVWVLGLGALVARLATPAGEPRRAGVLGLACLATSVSYYGLFGFWDTAQCEIWYAGLALLALRAVTRRTALERDALVGGVWAGLALLMKPPAALLLLVVAVVLARRACAQAPPGRGLPRAAAGLARFAAGAALPLGATALYFAAAGALGHLVDQAFRANYHDMRHSATASSPAELALRMGEYLAKTGPLLPGAFAAALGGLALARRRDDAEAQRRHAIALGLLGAGVAAVVAQRKFYGYHWGALAPLMALALAGLVHDLAARAPRPARLGPWAPAAAAAALLLAGFATTSMAPVYAATVARACAYAAGRIDRDAFLAPFVVDDNTPYAQQEVVGRWLRAHSAPTDQVAVRGFEQTIYAVAQRRAPTSFFWTRWLTEPRRAYRREEWLAQDLQALRARPPRYVVVNERARKGPASQAHFVALGYVERFRHGRLIVLERKQTGADGTRAGAGPPRS
jgi:hypothetical protein